MLKHYVPREPCIRWHAPPRNFQESILQNTRVPPERYRIGGDKLNTTPLGLGTRQAHCLPGAEGEQQPEIYQRYRIETYNLMSHERLALGGTDPGIPGVRVTEYRFPTRGVQGRWRQALTPTPPRPRNQTGTLSAGCGKVANRRYFNGRNMGITG